MKKKSSSDSVDKLLEQARADLKHPHFHYAVIDTQKSIIEYRLKPFWKWFSGKKDIRVKIIKFNCAGLSDYHRPNIK